MTGVGAVAAWTGPALVVAVVARVTAGGVEAPLFVLAVLTAPLLALLAGPEPRERSGTTFAVAVLTVACLLTAGFRALLDVGHVVGLEPGAVLGAAVALVLATTLWPGHHRVSVAALALGLAALVVALVIVGSAVGAAPWTVWSRVASRVAFELGPRSPWTGEGAHFGAPLTLTVTEPHRIAAVEPVTLRVTDHDRPAAVVRERRLAAGESLLLRPGDTASIPAGARLRFERGKRVPGTPPSGVAWADAAGTSRLGLLGWWLGLTVTLTGGALLVVRLSGPSARAGAVLGPAGALGVTLAATCWGLYALDAAPELSIGAPPAAALARLAPIVVDEPWRSRLVSALVVALLGLLLGSAAALRQRLVDLADRAGDRVATSSTSGGALGTAIWLVLVIAAGVAATFVADGWSVLLHGAGLAAATLLGPLLATGNRHGSERARAAGALVGGTVAIGLFGLGQSAAAAGALHAVLEFPALVAVPAAWAVAMLARGSAPERRPMVAAARRR